MRLPRLFVFAALLPAAALAQPGVDANRPTDRPWPDSLVGGTAPPADVQRLYAVAAAVDADRIEANVRRLAGFGTRHTLSDTVSDTRGIGAARRWIRAEFERISAACGGCLEVVEQRRVISGERRIPEPVEVVNVLAIQRGTADPDRYVVMSGDIDSRASDALDATSDAPGANDNASGMAGAIEAARVLSQYEFPGTIVYTGLSGEEQGLFGGQIMAETARAEGWRIEAVLNNDMIGNSCGIDGVCDNTSARVFSEATRPTETEQEARLRRFTGGEVDGPSRNLARAIDRLADQYVRNLDVMMVYRLDRFGRGGHHTPFTNVGYPGVRIMETHEHYDRQHQDLRTEAYPDGTPRHYGDTVEYVDFDYAAKLTALNAVALAAFAGAPAPPSGVTIEGAVRPSTTLRWERPDAAENPQLAGFRVNWRLTTSPQWERSVFVPDNGEAEQHYTLGNVVIDNYLFGVSSVAADGSESPVVFPGAIGAFDYAPGE
ncbi:M28 family peptidase [Rubrivirga litoralis]|uniref:M28 family peptidase n=1 Tax=Rubrivirga litoralis TaxID=3075598 RepID=A0ABU3BS13_9BACT|nr:M28 family peptidase [Rubrivirga sp. F394]MDT0632045.1 M28 family peptidase [Rubrivirga sp. F394]